MDIKGHWERERKGWKYTRKIAENFMDFVDEWIKEQKNIVTS